MQKYMEVKKMAIGSMEGVIIGGVILLGIIFFGRAGIKRLAETIFGAKKDIEDVKNQFEVKV